MQRIINELMKETSKEIKQQAVDEYNGVIAYYCPHSLTKHTPRPSHFERGSLLERNLYYNCKDF